MVKLPLVSVCAARVSPVSTCLTVIAAPCNMAPDTSLTDPVMVAVEPRPRTKPVPNATDATSPIVLLAITSLPSCDVRVPVSE